MELTESIAEALQVACQSQDRQSVVASRETFAKMIPTWLVQHLPGIASKTLDLTDAEQCRRLLLLCCLIDEQLAMDLAYDFMDANFPFVAGIGFEYLDDPVSFEEEAWQGLNDGAF